MGEILSGNMFIKATASLLLVFVLLVFLVYVLRFLQTKKKLIKPKKDQIHVSQVHHINAKQKLMVVQWQGKENLICANAAGGFVIDQVESKQESKNDVS